MEHEIDIADGERSFTMSENTTSNQIEAALTSASKMHIDTKDQNYATAETTMSDEESQPLTHALEALLGGLEPLNDRKDEKTAASPTSSTPDTAMKEIQELKVKADEDQTAVDENMAGEEDKAQETNADMNEVQGGEKGEGLEGTEIIMKDADTQSGESRLEAAIKQSIEAFGPRIPGLTMNKEMTIDENVAAKIENAELLLAPAAAAMPEGQEVIEGEHPEWEADSSPIESSSDDSSDSSSDESDDGDNADLLLTAEEQARILMEGDGGSDDEGGKTKGSGGPLRTANEIPDVVIPKPDVTITEAMTIRQLGAVETVVENILLIKANTSGEYQVLESGSVLCLEDRTVFGVVAETIGRVQQPFYSVMFTNAAELQAANVPVGTKVFYTDMYATFVFTQALKAYKGSDASNIHDEEVGDEEVEFSDDEKEAEHRKRVKQKRAERRGGKAQQNGGPRRGGHPLQQSSAIHYDDPDDDGPYRPLARPVGYADSVGRAEAPQEGYQNGQERPRSSRGDFRGRGRGGDRGRGDRGRGRGDRGRGRGGFQDNRNEGHSLPPRPPQSFAQPPAPAPPTSSTTPFPQMPGFPNFFMPPNMPPNMQPNTQPNMQHQNMPQYSPHQPHVGWPQFQQAFQNMQTMPSWPTAPPVLPPAQNGAYVNPAFFPNGANGQAGIPPPQWYQQNQQNNQNLNGRGRGRGQ